MPSVPPARRTQRLVCSANQKLTLFSRIGLCLVDVVS